MKKIFMSVALLASIGAYSQNDKKVPTKEAPSYYCAHMKDGLVVVMKENKVLLSDALLSNGAKITVDATLIKADGTNIKLQDGNCVSLDGELAGSDPQDHIKQKK